MSSNTQFRGVSNVGDVLLSELLETNLLYFCDWAMLELGAFTNVSIPTSGIFGGDFSRLRQDTDPAYTDGQCWSAVRSNWVWETGISRGVQPIRVSGVFVNGNFHPVTGVGPYKHIIDYRNGRIVFDSPISTASTVRCEYSYRTYNFYTAETAPQYIRDIQYNSLRVDDSHFLQTGSGEWDTRPDQRIQLPAVIVNAEPRTRPGQAYELGNLVRYALQDVSFNILAEAGHDYKRLHDILTYQTEHQINLFDKAGAIKQGMLGLDFNGSPYASSLMYPDLVNQFAYKVTTFDAVSSHGGVWLEQPLYYCQVRSTMKTLIP